jgi:hypothetical protein
MENTKGSNIKYKSLKQQASSAKLQFMEKLQAASAKLSKPQATSIKPRGASFKLQAASYKLQDPVSLIKFQATRIVDLDYDKTILGMPHMEADLVW